MPTSAAARAELPRPEPVDSLELEATPTPQVARLQQPLAEQPPVPVAARGAMKQLPESRREAEAAAAPPIPAMLRAARARMGE